MKLSSVHGYEELEQVLGGSNFKGNVYAPHYILPTLVVGGACSPGNKPS